MKVKTIHTTLFCLLLCLAASGAASAQLSAINDYDAFGYGDGVRIIAITSKTQNSSAAEFIAQLNGDYVIDGEGFVVLPKFGQINVIGLSPRRLEENLKEKLQPLDEDPIIIIIPLLRVTLLGQFARPGSYRVDPSNSLWDVIREAGGPAPDCRIKDIRIHREGEVLEGDLFSSWEKGSALSDIGVRSGDIIFAPKKRKLTFRDFVIYFQFGISLIWLYLSATRNKW